MIYDLKTIYVLGLTLGWATETKKVINVTMVGWTCKILCANDSIIENVGKRAL